MEVPFQKFWHAVSAGRQAVSTAIRGCAHRWASRFSKTPGERGARPVDEVFYGANQALSPGLPAMGGGAVLALFLVLGLTCFCGLRKTVALTVDGKTCYLKTRAETVSDLLKERGISIGEADLVKPEPSAVLEEGAKVAVKHAVPVRVWVDNGEKRLLTTASTVGAAIKTAPIAPPTAGDEVFPDPKSPITQDMIIRVVRVTERIETIKMSIPFETISREDTSLLKGGVRVVVPGREGTVLRTFKITYRDGREAGRVLESEEAIEASVNRLVRFGTRRPIYAALPARISRGGERVQMLIATAYTPGYDCGTRTATGMKAGRGVVAVDPRVIPLGTRLYIEGYGEALAADTGGAIKGNRIDLCFDTLAEARAFGRRRVAVRTLD